ncbi:flagellar hook-associated protein FlgL [Ilumatobacter sp.]|uniref:flagellar hook-associated protein FlgL n=1 Tax=Ilumatobacter sp. TaxID=1967498 RepID=UPI003B52078E
MTNSMMIRSTLGDLSSSLDRLQRNQAKVSSGKAIQRVSDDPARAVDALALRQRLRRTEQLMRTAEDTAARLQSADTALVSSFDVLNRVKELTVQASNGGASSDTSRAAISSELRGLRDELIGIANTEYLGRSLFNGTATGSAYDPASGAYLGNSTNYDRTVAAGVTVSVNLTGEQIFGAQGDPAGDVFAVIDRLAAAVGRGDLAALTTEHSHLDDASLRVSGAAAEIGRRARHLTSITVRSETERAELSERISLVEDVDFAEALLSMKASENAYQATLQAASRVLPPSLIDFLR